MVPLIDVAGIAPSGAVVVTTASSSVGLAAIQIVNAMGAVSIATTRTGAQGQALLNHGAQHVIVAQEQDLAKEGKRITDGKGVSRTRPAY